MFLDFRPLLCTYVLIDDDDDDAHLNKIDVIMYSV